MNRKDRRRAEAQQRAQRAQPGLFCIPPDASPLPKHLAAQLVRNYRNDFSYFAHDVVWRHGVVKPSREHGGPGRGKRVSAGEPVLPEADPGKVIIHRWRKRLCTDVCGRDVGGVR